MRVEIVNVEYTNAMRETVFLYAFDSIVGPSSCCLFISNIESRFIKNENSFFFVRRLYGISYSIFSKLSAFRRNMENLLSAVSSMIFL